MNEERLRTYLIRDKGFLKSLFSEESVTKKKRLLNGARDSQLLTLIYFLHFLSNGEVKMKKEHFQNIEKAKLSLLKKKIESKKALNAIVSSDRRKKVLLLYKICDRFNELLYPLFNES
jgi:hypothetical protein